ncbi:MAG: lamin tail domain-containing protein [Candidatus Adlerbacteria bacterium]|nr:lamin tail domain-containing protein [Candidatus Adlerbacteria bacterium]MDZ4226046.1 lamin tail domain-containing protein [Patescibacteria group bacterium]
MKKILRSVLVLCLFVVPAQALAAVLITEVLYDLEGADQGYEWLELTNTGTTPVDISAWRLFENGTNHKLTLVQGASAVLQPGQSAVVADKAEYFITRYPAVGVVFDSAFSLSNEMETLMLKNAGGDVVDQLTYRSSLGAKGDGASLHLEGEILTPALPNPGVYPGELVPVAKKQADSKTSAKTSSAVEASSLAAVGSASISSSTFVLLPWLVALLSIILLGVAGVWLVKEEQKNPETKALADEFEIVES